MLPPPSLRIRDMRQMEMSENQGIRVLLWIRIVIFLQLSSSEAGLHITSGSSPIQAPLRHNVTIPCFLTDDNRQELDLDLSTASVRWEITPIQGEQHRVYLLTNHVHTPFRPKSHIEQIDFKKGNASLFLQDVQESDEGEYTCSIFITPDKLTATIAVQVSARPAITLSSSEIAVEPEHEKSVICKVNRFYPKAITIRWFKSNKDSSNRSPLDKETCNSVPAENGDGTFNATSLVLVKPSSKAEDGDTYYCLVTHRSFSSDQAVDFILKVEEQPTTFQEWVIAVAVLLAVMVVIPLGIALALYCIGVSPKLLAITGAEYLVHEEKSRLSCMILGFTPKTLSINVYLKRTGDSKKQHIFSCNYLKFEAQEQKDQYRSVEDQPQQQDCPNRTNTLKAEVGLVKLRRLFFLHDCQCNIDITPDISKDEGGELMVEAVHKALKSPKSVSCKLNINGDCLTLSDIMASGTPEYGKELTLSCEFRKYIPGPLQVTWLKKDVMKPDLIIYKDGKICDNRYKHKESEENHIGCDYISSSFLTFLVDIRLDQRKKYVCKVEYPAIKQTKKSKLTTQVIAIPVVGAIMPDPAIPSAGQQMTLSCDICFFYPKEDLTVEWYKENEPLPAPNNEIKVDNNNLYNATSTVTLSLEMKDLGKKFQCKVSHHSMKTPEIREWTMKTP
ncbi:uncharacterized protein [Hyperolius riggenbachi]|uniref:uncharacterized protein isoform X1 n=1 Tax=Hyperolius riggenbachi TaxID=752182 RepID=UPI0035A31D83